jgi:hypothetical protein
MKPLSDEDAVELLRSEEARRTVPEQRFGLRNMRRTITLSILYAVAIFCMSRAAIHYSLVFFFFAILSVVFTLIDEYDQFSRKRTNQLIELLRIKGENEK